MMNAFRRNHRALTLLFSMYPKIFISVFCYQLVHALLPFVSIYGSARIIQQLLLSEYTVVWRYVSIVMISTAVLMLLEAMAKRWAQYEKAGLYYKQIAPYTKKLFGMDFSKIDDSKTYELLSQIKQTANWSDWGFGVVFDTFESLVLHSLTIIFSVSLTTTLFQQPVTKETMLFLNNGIVIAMFCLMLVSVIALAAWMETKSAGYWKKASVDAVQGNRTYQFFFEMMSQNERAMDIRIYQQVKEADKILDNDTIFIRSGKMASYARKEMGGLMFLARFLSSSLTIFIYGFVGLKALGGAFSVGMMIQYIGSIAALVNGLNALFQVLGLMKNNADFLETTFQFLDIENEMYQGSLTIEKRLDHNYEIEFRNVSFQYPNREEYALRNLNYTFQVGNRLAIVGMNGSGKTTFIKLLCRLYDPSEGEILLNGIDIRKYEYQEYMSIFSVVFQDFQLLSFTLAENVAASSQYNSKQVEDIMTQAGFDIDVDKFKHGIKTSLNRDFDDEGIEVSSGEGQKIAIARALYRNSAFVILDEPTASLDPIAEQDIYERFDEIVKNKTTIFISHRLSSCKFADEIAVFDGGTIVEHGTHKELLRQDASLYSTLWNAQASYYQTSEAMARL